MTKAAVIGAPISHSRSPAIFSFLAKTLGNSAFQYSALEIQAAGLADFLKDLKKQRDFVGINVTIPHKEALLPLLDEVAPEARAVGAVNVVHQDGGRLLGYNTDVLGIVETLVEQKCRMAGEDAWIWGAGGAARAVAYALGRMGARSVYLQNRDPARASKICDELGALLPETRFMVAQPGAEARTQPLSLLVNATPLGMKGMPVPQGQFSNLRELRTKRDALAFDLIYNPERTPFLDLAEDQGLRTVSGLDMLIYQALATWEIWMGPMPAAAQAKNSLAQHLRERPIFLTGFMGVGKSVVGIELASKLGWEFADTDEWIVRRAGMPISKIFETQGEAAFRALESSVIAEVSSKHRTVVSLGGGALLNSDNFKKIEQAGSLVFLDASPEFLQQRLMTTASTRPLLSGLDEKARGQKIQELLETRKPVYNQAQFKITTDGSRTGEVAEGILRLLFSPAVFHSIAHSKVGA